MAEHLVQSHIRSLPLFEQLSPPQVGVVARIAQVLRFEPGQLVFQEGQPTQGLMLFVSGSSILTRRAANGLEERIGAVASGQYINETALYTAGVESASLRVVETAIVVLIPRGAFVHLMSQYPEIRANMRVQVSPLLRETGVKLFKGQRDDETVMQVWRRHWWAAARYFWVPLLVAVALFALALVVAERAPILALGAAGLAVVIPGVIIFYLWYDWQDDSVVLSDQRVVRIWNHILSFESTLSEIPLDRVLEVNTTIPPGDPFARIFQYGNVFVKTSGGGSNMMLDMMPQPLHVQSMIFAQRDLLHDRLEQRKRDSIRSDVAQALGMNSQPQQQPAVSGSKADTVLIGLPFIRTKFRSPNGDLVYRKHSSIWLGGVMWPLLLIGAAFVMMAYSLLARNSVLAGGVGLALGMFMLLIGVLWFYAADWDWRNDVFILGSDTITLIRKRPLWLQNEVERIRISQIDNVKSDMRGLSNSLLKRGSVRISLIGSDAKDAKIFDSIYDPQAIQAEISRRQSAIKAERQISDLDQQREVMKEYLQTYHEMQGQPTREQAPMSPTATQPPVQPSINQFRPPPAPPSVEPPIMRPIPEEPPPPPRDGNRPPRIPRARPSSGE